MEETGCARVQETERISWRNIAIELIDPCRSRSSATDHCCMIDHPHVAEPSIVTLNRHQNGRPGAQRIVRDRTRGPTARLAHFARPSAALDPLR